ncbi:MAG TPA: hypothetical protein DCP92_21700 [Nitrospiraceae bacterium]|jgi:hypothetical protein|nr:hypothetical protein [Nitrospiraceae bacterium]
MSNTRRRKRFRKHCKIEFVTNNTVHRGISTDLSLRGLFIQTNSPLPPDTILDVVLHLNDGMTAKLKVKVKWFEKVTEATTIASKHGMGVEIIEKDPNYLRFIASLLGRYEGDDSAV